MPRLLTVDANIFIAKIKGDEESSDKCREIITKGPSQEATHRRLSCPRLPNPLNARRPQGNGSAEW